MSNRVENDKVNYYNIIILLFNTLQRATYFVYTQKYFNKSIIGLK